MRAVLAQRRGEADARRELEDAVCAYVQELKRAGVPPERVIVSIKSLVDAPPPPDVPLSGGIGPLSHVVDWCIRAYYEEQG